MPSTYGARHGLVGYDRFRTGLCFATVSQMLRVESDDPSDWRQKSRGCVLGLWHSLKMALYGQSVDSMLGGPSVRKIQTGWNELVEKPVYGFVTSGDVRSVRLVDTNSASAASSSSTRAPKMPASGRRAALTTSEPSATPPTRRLPMPSTTTIYANATKWQRFFSNDNHHGGHHDDASDRIRSVQS
jgi:hypothetical protein